MVSALAGFGVSLNARLTVFDRDTWKEALTQVYDFERLNSVVQEVGPELSADMRDEELGRMHELRTAFAHEASGVAQLLQPSLERYISNAVDGIWDYLTGESEVIDLGPVSYIETVESGMSELHSRVTAVREGSAEPESETVASLAELPAEEFDAVLAGVGELYQAGFLFMEPLAQGAGEQVHQPTAEDEAFRRSFHEAVSAIHTIIFVSAIVVLLCIGVFLLLGGRTGTRSRLIGNALLWYSVLSLLFFAAVGAFSGFIARRLQELAAAEADSPQAGDQAANTVRAILAEYGDIAIRFFVPLMVFVAIAFGMGLLLRMAGRGRTAGEVH